MTREEAIKEINRVFEPAFANYIIIALTEGATPSDRALKQEPKTGHWIETYSEIDAKYGMHSYKCSECGKHANYFVAGTEHWWDAEEPNFCPNCGIKMIEPQESEG